MNCVGILVKTWFDSEKRQSAYSDEAILKIAEDVELNVPLGDCLLTENTAPALFPGIGEKTVNKVKAAKNERENLFLNNIWGPIRCTRPSS